MEYILSALIGFLLGSIPSAYLIVKRIKGVDIRTEGSSNVGALNSMQVSESKLVGISVLISDFIKGLLSVDLVQLIFGDLFLPPMLAWLFAVIGHCYSPWIGFKGGRGLATAAGGALLFSPAILGIWLFLWVVAYVFRKDVHFGNIAATVLSAGVILTSGEIINKYTFPPADDIMLFKVLASTIFLIIFIKHLKPLMDYFQKQKEKIRGNKDEEY